MLHGSILHHLMDEKKTSVKNLYFLVEDMPGMVNHTVKTLFHVVE